MEQKLLGIWNKMDLFFKTITVMLGVTLVILLLAINDHNTLAIVFSIFQVIGLVVASLIHINVIISVKKWITDWFTSFRFMNIFLFPSHTTSCNS